MKVASKGEIKDISEALPGINCDWCGFETCAQLAGAIAGGIISPYGCRRDPWSGRQINKIINGKSSNL